MIGQQDLRSKLEKCAEILGSKGFSARVTLANQIEVDGVFFGPTDFDAWEQVTADELANAIEGQIAVRVANALKAPATPEVPTAPGATPETPPVVPPEVSTELPANVPQEGGDLESGI